MSLELVYMAVHYLPPPERPVRFEDPKSVPQILCGTAVEVPDEFARTERAVTCKRCRDRLRRRRRAA